MKKLPILILFALTAIVFTGCNDEAKQDITRNYVVKDRNWEQFEDAVTGYNRYLECSADFPEITDYVLDYGSVHGYVVFSDGIYPLPYTRWYDAGRGVIFDETFTFGYTRGQVHFRYSNSDFYYEDEMMPFTFKVVVSGY